MTEPHVTHLANSSISKLAPFSGLIISIIFVLYFLVRFYILEGFLLRLLYGEIYLKLSETDRRGFVNHHIAGTTKILILIIAAYPFADIAFGNSTLHSPFGRSPYITQGDILIVAAQMLIAMYVFELFYRPRISPVSIAHHIGTIMIGQSAIAISLELVRERDATIEFVLCTVWGAFDIISEFLPHVAIILYRVYPDSHLFLTYVFGTACITTLIGTTTETILTMYLFGSLWHQWTLAFKVVTPILHVLFSAAQLWGSFVLFKMWRRQRGLLVNSEVSVNETSERARGIGLTVAAVQETETRRSNHSSLAINMGNQEETVPRDGVGRGKEMGESQTEVPKYDQ